MCRRCYFMLRERACCYVDIQFNQPAYLSHHCHPTPSHAFIWLAAISLLIPRRPLSNGCPCGQRCWCAAPTHQQSSCLLSVLSKGGTGSLALPRTSPLSPEKTSPGTGIAEGDPTAPSFSLRSLCWRCVAAAWCEHMHITGHLYANWGHSNPPPISLLLTCSSSWCWEFEGVLRSWFWEFEGAFWTVLEFKVDKWTRCQGIIQVWKFLFLSVGISVLWVAYSQVYSWSLGLVKTIGLWSLQQFVIIIQCCCVPCFSAMHLCSVFAVNMWSL